jgi:two-component system CheB/CheR fusion protein
MKSKDGRAKKPKGPVTPVASPSNDIALEDRRVFPIVGIGASAGGLAAFEAFFSNLPADSETGMAFVLVQHLAPDHKSMLCDLVKRYTRMQVMEVTDGITVEPSHAYIIPPNRDMTLLDGRLYLNEPAAPRGLRLPIDFFFKSLARDQRDRAICVVLSGTGSDGALGLKAIKGEGGMAMAQDPATTEYDGMPRNAIGTGLVDYVLPPADMPAQLTAYVEHAFGRKLLPVSPPTPRVDNALNKILALIRIQVGHDFSQYKHNTIGRRVERRMAVNQIGQIEEYILFLRQNPAEVNALFKDLLIGVTNFFRDSEAFDTLQRDVLPRLLAKKKQEATIRVWAPGCSTGEEAYSLAILFQELLDNSPKALKLQIFATDIDGPAIEQARAGRYPPSVAADITPERLNRFFTQDQDGGPYHIQKRIRDVLVFSEQDVGQDPPFSRLDFVSCRNLLIYMGAGLQKKVISLFHYALNPGGILFLGGSESVGDAGDLFITLDRKRKIFQRRDTHSPRPGLADFSHAPLFPGLTLGKPVRGAEKEGRVNVKDLTEKTLLQQYAPAAALVNDRGEILYIHGRTGQYLEPAEGEAGLNILNMAREGLRTELTIALRHVAVRKEPVRYSGLRVKANGDTLTVDLMVQPAADGSLASSGLFVVTFQSVARAEPLPSPPQAGGPSGDTGQVHDERIVALERDLRAKDEYLQTTIEELETSNEELKSTNEELQSANEELQSTNEELETSKEELQSVNEELATVNAELQNKVDQLVRANNDMNNLLAGTGVGTIFLDHQSRIQRFTPAVTQVIHLIQSDIGRPVSHLASNLTGYDRLMDDTQNVLNDLIPREHEAQSKSGAWYLTRIRPYRTLENVIEGAVITFVDITEQKKAQESLKESEYLNRLATVVQDSSDAVMLLNFEGRILAWNPGAQRFYGWTETEALAMTIWDMIPESRRDEVWDIHRRLGLKEKVEPFRTQRLTKNGQALDIWLTATALVKEDGRPYAIATTEKRTDPLMAGRNQE